MWSYMNNYAKMNIFYCHVLVTKINFIMGLTYIHYIAYELIIDKTATYATKTCIVSVSPTATPRAVAPFCPPDKCNG